MKKIIPVVMFALFSQGCGNKIAEQVEDVKWQDNHSKIGNVRAYTQFSAGEVRSCTSKSGKWETIAHYKIDQNTLTLQADNEQEKEKSFVISFKGQGNDRKLILRIGDNELEFPVARSAECPL
jgi:hypothetical protein